MALPLWPGFCFDKNLGKTNRPRVQVLDRIHDTSYTYYNDKLTKSKNSRNNILSDSRGVKGPSWVVYDKKVLCFDGYWLEGVMEEPDKFYNCRSCKVFYYLEDDTIQVLEPRIRNSKLCQGTVVKRRKILKPPPNDDDFYNVFDFNIGEVLLLCGRHIKITSCDNFTLNYLRHLGIDIHHPIQQPIDPIESLKNNLINQKKGKGFYRRSDNLSQFLDFNKYILRFYCFWDNRDIHHDPRSLILHYYLEDDTIEILENLPPNCGRIGKAFLLRNKLPKHFTSCSLNFPGQINDPFYLNVIKTRSNEHKLIDSSNINENKDLYYRDCDLSVGQYINVYGRKFLLCDCDEFTKEFYRKKYGIFAFQSINMNQYWPQDYYIEKFIPPYNGWGTEEDSLRNCLSIRPSEIIKSNRQFINSKRTIDDLLFINFLAKIYKPENTLDATRRFIFSYGIEDDKFLIMEYSYNSKALFLLRDRHMKHKKVWKDIYIPEYYEAVDFHIGAIIYVKGLELLLFSSDEYSLKYMEKNCHKFIHSSIDRILAKLRKRLLNAKSDVEYFFKSEDQNDSGLIHFNELETFKKYFADDILSMQELVTLGRFYTYKNQNPGSNKMKSIAQIRDTLRINNFIDFYKIKENWYSNSPEKSKLPISVARSILKSMKIPLSDEMLCDLLKLSCLEPNEVDLCSLLEIIEWQKFQPHYFNFVGKYLECENIIPMLKTYPETELSPEKHLKIGEIQWKILMNDIINHPKISKSHPSAQKLIFNQHCK